VSRRVVAAPRLPFAMLRALLLGSSLALLAGRPAGAQSAPRTTAALTPVPDAQGMQREYRARREALAARMGDGILVALGASEPVRDYESFSQTPDFFYLTGWREPDAALVMVRRGDSLATTLFVSPRDPAREVWSGVRAGPEAAAQLTGMAARPRAALDAMLDSLAGAGLPVHALGVLSGRAGGPRTADDQFFDALRATHPGLRVNTEVGRQIAELRGRKSAAELALIRRAVELTVLAHREALGALEPGMNEFELQALIEYTFRRNGADRPSFATIVGSGPNATTLHYNADDRFIQAGDLVVMDIGASYRGYAADVTRTLPATGRFTAEQRAIYQLVRDAQAAAERQAKPGAPAQRMNDSATAVLAAGLARLGLIESASATYDCAPARDGGAARQCPQLTLFYMHGLGHGIGLDVHDPDQYYFTGTVAPGSVFTLEPGVYVRANLLDILPDTPRNRALAQRIGAAVRRYANIGVRIEDDYVVTETGAEWISRAPREIDEIERAMAAPYAGPARRATAMVESYRGTP